MAQVCATAARKCESQVPRTSRHGMGGNRPGAQDGAPAPVGAVAPRRDASVQAPRYGPLAPGATGDEISVRNRSIQTVAPGMPVPGALSPQRRPDPLTGRRSRLAVAPNKKNARRARRLVLSPPETMPRFLVRVRGAGAQPEPPRSRALDGWLVEPPVDSPRPVYEPARIGNRGVTATSHPGAIQIDEPPSRTGFITALDDAYLMPRDEGYAVFWRTSGHDLCTVEADVAERALRRQGPVVRLGTWSGTLRGRDGRLDAVVGARGPVGLDQRRRGRRGRACAHRPLAGRTGARAGARPALGAAASGRRAAAIRRAAAAAPPRAPAHARRPARPVPHAVAGSPGRGI